MTASPNSYENSTILKIEGIAKFVSTGHYNDTDLEELYFLLHVYLREADFVECREPTQE